MFSFATTSDNSMIQKIGGCEKTTQERYAHEHTKHISRQNVKNCINLT